MPTGVRREGREIALQTLYEWDTTQHDVEAVLRRHGEERRLTPRVIEFARELVHGVLAHHDELDKTFGSDASARFVNGVLGTIFLRSQGSPASGAGSEVR
jgi:transcription termination factor NusB